MVIESRFSFAVPECSVQQWLFGSCSGPLKWPDKKIWIDADNPDTRYLTYHSCRLLAKRIAVGLLERGLKPGDRVLIFSGNKLIFPVLVYATWMAGGVFTGANPTYVARELTYQLKNTEASFLIAAEGSWDVAKEAADNAGLPKTKRFVLDEALPNADEDAEALHPNPQHWTKLVASKEKGEAFQWHEPTNTRDTLATLNYSSGTTGLPKGVEITHFNIIANNHGTIEMEKMHPEHAARLAQGAGLCFLPMYHAFCQAYFMGIYPKEGMPVYIMPQFDLLKMLRHIEAFRISKLIAVPPVLLGLAKHPQTRKTDLSSLDTVGSGAAPLPPDVQRTVSDMLGAGGDELRVRQGWGMTELTCTGLTWDPRVPIQEGVGELVADAKAKLVDPASGREILEANVPGELFLSSPTVMRGYWRNPEATAATLTTDENGIRWLATGDIAYVAEYRPGGLFHIVDRAKELIKVRGNQVSPSELDAVILEREDVVDVGVVGVPDADGDEVPRAYIVRKEGTNCSAQELDAWVSKRVAPFKRLRGGIVFTDAIPKNPSGKILRRALKEQAKKEVAELRAKL